MVGTFHLASGCQMITTAATTPRMPKRTNTPRVLEGCRRQQDNGFPGHKAAKSQPGSNWATTPASAQITASGRELADELSQFGMSTKSQGLSLKVLETYREKHLRTTSPNNHGSLRMGFNGVCVGSHMPA